MKLTIGLVLAVFCATNMVQAVNIFEKNFQMLHHGPPPPPAEISRASRATTQTKWIVQKLDNFDPSETRTWNMRYLVNDAYFKAGSPIFINVGGEWTINDYYLRDGHFHDIAKEHSGLLIGSEHRYYGQSRPTSNLSTQNLKWLDIKQALADLAHLIVTLKATTPGLENSKVILTGGSYAGTMVTWFKKLYPDLVTGAWSSSAPLLAKVNFVEYNEVTGEAIKLVGGDACYNRIQNGVAELEQMIANKRGAEVKSLFKICSDFDENNDLDRWLFFDSISNMWAGTVQYHHHYYQNIENACAQLMKGNSDVNGLANFVLWYVGNSRCTDYSYKGWVSYLSATSNIESGMYRQWIYQTCNEYGWFQTSGSKSQPFGSSFPEDLGLATCKDVYGAEFTKSKVYQNIDDTNEFFGGINPEVDDVYQTHGSLDPWSPMGILDENQATIIPLHTHCSDYWSISWVDTPEMVASKERLAELVRQWLSEDTVKVSGRKYMRQFITKF